VTTAPGIHTGNQALADSRPGAGATRDRILDEAEGLFAERGLAGTSVRDIASRVGLTAASLYNHFAGKQALYEAVLERGIHPLLELMGDLAGREQSVDAGDAVIGAVMDHLAQRPHLARLIHHESLAGGENLARLARDWIQPLTAHGLAAMERDPQMPWEPREFPMVIAAWIHLIFGHFAMAPLLAEVTGEDPLSPRGLERQTEFLRKLSRILMRPEGSGA
jgi:AcrR family transcriptional regulator